MVDKGIYVLIIQLGQSQKIPIGALGEIEFESGFYLYIGSAQNGLENRINRHLRDEKKKHWHIDYLLDHGEVIDVKVNNGDSNEECLLAEKIRKFTQEIQDFGSSDCKCGSHLFYYPNSLSKLKNQMQKLNVSDY